MERGTTAVAAVKVAGGRGIGFYYPSHPYNHIGVCPSVLPYSCKNLFSGTQMSRHSFSDYFLNAEKKVLFHPSTFVSCSNLLSLSPGYSPSRVSSCLKEDRYVIRHSALKRCPISMRAFSSCGPQEASLGNDNILIDCGPDQECVLGGIVALGKFDALHIGHRELAIQASKAGVPFLLSFVGMAQVLGWEHRAPIVANCDRKRVLSSWAPDCGDVIPLEFQVEFSRVRHLTPRQFVEKLSKELRISGVVAGENYRFGYKASGDATELVRLCKDYGLSAYIVSSVMDKSQRSYNGSCTGNSPSRRGQVSSTRVRHALAMGDMEYVAELLGRRHRLVLTVNEGVVCEGNMITAPRSSILNQPPKEGSYGCCTLLANDVFLGSCRVEIDSRHINVDLDGTADTRSTREPLRDCQFISIEFG